MRTRVTTPPVARLLGVTQQPISRTLTQDVHLQCLDARGRSIDLPAALSYDPSDPWAVRLDFGRPGDTVQWVVGRDLLLEGVTDPAGEGDVMVWPSIDEYCRAVVVLEFCSPHGRLVTQVSTRELNRFLARTVALVPRGAEAIDLDELVAELTGSPTE